MRAGFILSVVLVVLAWTDPVRAQATERQKEAAREQLRLGDEWLKKNNLDKAADAYRNADDIMSVPTTSIEVVRIELKRGRLKEAFEACYKTARHPEQAGEPPPFTRARKEARELIAALKKRIPRVTIALTGLDRGVSPRVSVDDEVVQNYSDLLVNPGSHQAVATATGHLTSTADFEVSEGEHKTITLKLAKATSKVVTVVAPRSFWPLVYAGIGVAGAGVVVGSITGGLSLSDTATLQASCQPDTGECGLDQLTVLNRAHALANASTAGFVAAGVGAAVAIPALVLSLRGTASQPTPRAAMTPLFDSAGKLAAGASMCGAW
jgi:hypothetical protein